MGAQAYEDEDGTTPAWRLTAYAVRAPPTVGLHQAAMPAATRSDPVKGGGHCSVGYAQHAAGASSSGAPGQLALPFWRVHVSTLESVFIAGITEAETGFDGSRTFRASAVCAQ